ncbi:MAG: acyl dehydratase [Halioglobus sp.]|nr:acyl dehydratase [Halioglobus sp.]
MNTAARIIELDSIPGLPGMLVKAATSRKPAQREPQFPPLVITARGITADTAKLQKFNEVCGFAGGEHLPLTYPHIMAFALHMQLMLEPEFPFTPMGAVHVRNRISQRRALRAGEALDFTVRLGDAEQVAKGYEVSIVTEVAVAGETVWDDLSVMLIRKGGSGEKKAKEAAAAPPEFSQSVQWQLPADMGRRYAAASGDYNPIHLYPITAKLMGFKRQIMHGMWSKSRCVAELLPAEHAGAASVDVAFKLPIFLPATVTLMHNSAGSGSDFELRDAAGEKPHLAGRLSLE